MNAVTDEELVMLVKKGEILSYEELVKRYERKLHFFVRRWLSDDHDIEEVVQDTLFKTYVGINKVDEKRKFSSYLYAIAKNEAITKIRKKKDLLPLHDYVEGGDGENIYEKIILEEKKTLLHRAMGKLNDMQRRVLKMYFFEELSYKRIQEKLGLPINTVKTLLRRSKISLAKKLKDEK